MGKAGLSKRRDETEAEWLSRRARAKQNERDRSEPIAPVEAQAHGDYRTGFVTHVETATKAHTLVNRGGTPVCRWEAAGKLDINQLAVIAMMERLWRLAGLNQRVTANYGERLIGGGNAEHRAANEIEAREDLHRIRNYFPGKLGDYWQVFEDVVRHGGPANDAGASLGYGSRGGEYRAHTIVCFVADVIAAKERM